MTKNSEKETKKMSNEKKKGFIRPLARGQKKVCTNCFTNNEILTKKDFGKSF